MEIGAKIYYEKSTGNVVQIVGQSHGNVIETTTEQDYETYLNLSQRVPETIDMIQLEYDQYKQDTEAGGIISRINLETIEPLFTYPDPIDPETPQEPRPALSKQVDMMQQDSGELKQAVAELSVVRSCDDWSI